MKATRGCPAYGVLRVTSSLGGGSAGLLSQAILRSDASIFNLVRISVFSIVSVILLYAD